MASMFKVPVRTHPTVEARASGKPSNAAQMETAGALGIPLKVSFHLVEMFF